mmetsp:Transcript_16461/g.25554  ORF Transcript_16461/g.25554 Transcript_16461/m.25554 type:complete len:282 (-) Transcript_16461:355-1200(-)
MVQDAIPRDLHAGDNGRSDLPVPQSIRFAIPKEISMHSVRAMVPNLPSRAAQDVLAKESDEALFAQYFFKVVDCPKAHVEHDWKTCPYAHPGEIAKRRPPQCHSFRICQEFRRQKTCKLGDNCPLAHGPWEAGLHPASFKSVFCAYGQSCQRPMCFFSHSQEELRVEAAQIWQEFDADQLEASRAEIENAETNAVDEEESEIDQLCSLTAAVSRLEMESQRRTESGGNDARFEQASLRKIKQHVQTKGLIRNHRNQWVNPEQPKNRFSGWGEDPKMDRCWF